MSRWHGVVALQAVALGIALVTPFVPSKTGSDWSMADLVYTDPSYAQKVLVNFVVVDSMLLVLGVVLFVAVRLGVGRGNP